MYTIIYFLDYGETYGGAAHTLLQQARLVHHAGNSVHIFFSNYQGNKIDKEYQRIIEGYDFEVQMVSFQLSSQPEDIDVVCLKDHFADVLKTVQAYKPDLLHSVQLNPMAELISRELNIPHIMNIYPLSQDFFKLKYLDIFPHYHICDSIYWAEQWHKYLNTDYTCIRTVAVKMSQQPKREFGEELTCLCVGAIYSGKNQLEVIKGFQQAVAEGFHGRLLLYGLAEGTYADHCREYIEENQLDSYVHIMGFQSDMVSAYEKGDLLICGSSRESYPNVVSEAMAHGLLVLSTPVGGVPEVICDGENGYLTEGMDADSISKGLIRIKDDICSGRVEVVRRKGYLTVDKLHAPNVVEQEIIGYYGHVLDDFKTYRNINKPTINDVIDRFYTSIGYFKNNITQFTNVREASLKLWYMEYIRDEINQAIDSSKEFYVWGTGKLSKTVLEIISVFYDKIVIKGMIDSNRQGVYEKHKIYHPEEILSRKNVVVFVALYNGQWDVISILDKYQKKYLVDYFILSQRAW